MGKIQLFIATTLDGFIAREDGSLDWLFELPNPNQTDHGYNDFIADVDIIIMGRKTYDEVRRLEYDWHYDNCQTYIVTHDKDYRVTTGRTFVLNSIGRIEIDKLRAESKKNIWLVGGGELITQFLNLDEIDEMTISIIPIILGDGIRLFPGMPKETKLELVKSEVFDTRVVNLLYQCRSTRVAGQPDSTP